MVRELKPLEFLEELQKEYMLKSFGEIVNYDEYYQNGHLLLYFPVVLFILLILLLIYLQK